MRRARTLLLSMAVFVPLLAACGTDGGGDPSSALATRPTAASQEPDLGNPQHRHTRRRSGRQTSGVSREHGTPDGRELG